MIAISVNNVLHTVYLSVCTISFISIHHTLTVCITVHTPRKLYVCTYKCPVLSECMS